MYRAVVLVLLVAAALAAREKRGACHKLHPGLMHCCNKMFKDQMPAPEDGMQECIEKSKPPPSCEMEECLAKNLGYYGADGKMDMDGFSRFIEKKFANEPEFLNLVKENCLSDISNYGPPDLCDFIKMKMCFHKQFVQSCPEWSDEGECKGIKDMVNECKAD